MSLNKFLDFDKTVNIFFYNIYLKDLKFAIKIPISDSKKEKYMEDIKIEKFDLTRYTFLLNCE